MSCFADSPVAQALNPSVRLLDSDDVDVAAITAPGT
jgi:hypothetical protein